MKISELGSKRVVIIDAGPLVAAIDANDAHHRWARSTLLNLRGRMFSCEAVIAEAAHLLDNHPAAVFSLRSLAKRISVTPMLGDEFEEVFDLMERYSPQMDLADACLVTLARKHEGSIVLTTDTRDFSTYRIPFASPEGLFADR